jgi:hypothetical protein
MAAYIGRWDELEPSIKPTSIKGRDANPKAVENRHAKVLADRGTHRSADLPLWQVGPTFGGTPSRVF